MPIDKKVIIVAGPTASGKTALAIEIAKLINTEILSFDSRQCYKELKIGVARPSEFELNEVQHHFIASHSIHQNVTASGFENFALPLVDQLFKKHDSIVMVGGTGLYLKAFTEGMDEIPDIPEYIRAEINASYNSQGLSWLQNELKRLDPLFFDSRENKNPHRLIRALEVFKATGNSILFYQKGIKKARPFKTIKLALDIPKPVLHQRINNRVTQMIEEGLLEEVRSLIPFQHLKALQTVGYQELFDHLNGETTLTDAIENIRRNTRQYAKRQLTWFRKDPEISWFENPDKAVSYILKAASLK